MRSSENSPSKSHNKLLTINLISSDPNDQIGIRRDTQNDYVHLHSFENSQASFKKESLNNENNNIDSKNGDKNSSAYATYELQQAYDLIDTQEVKDIPYKMSTAKKSTLSKRSREDDNSISKRKSKSRVNSRSVSPTEGLRYVSPTKGLINTNEKDSHCRRHNHDQDIQESNSNLKRVVKINKMPPRADKHTNSQKKSPTREVKQKLYFEEV